MNTKCGRPGHEGLVTMCHACEVECRKERDALRSRVEGYEELDAVRQVLAEQFAKEFFGDQRGKLWEEGLSLSKLLEMVRDKMKASDVQNSELEGDLGRANETVSLLLGKLRDQLDGIIKDWGEAFAKHGFILHRGLTPEQNAAEWRAQIQLGVICKEVREKRVEEPRYCVKCGRRMEAADAAHVYTCEGKGDAVNPAKFID